MASAAAGLLVDCLVSPEWATAVTGVSTGHLQGELARLDLWQEYLLLEKLLYKNTNQHRGAQHFQRLQEVRRLLVLLKAMQLDRRVGALHDALQAGKQRGAAPHSASRAPLAYGTDQRRLPSHQAAAAVLHSLQAGCHLVEQLAGAAHRASLQLLAQLGHSFFMPLCLTSLAVLARIQVLTGQLMLDAVKAYNVLAEAAVLLPASPETSAAAGKGAGHTAAAIAAGAAAGAAAGGAAASGQRQQLPQMLRAQWRAGLPALECIPCPEGEGLEAQAAAACSRYAVQLVQPDLQAAAAAAMQQQQRRGGKQAPGLAVVEDRGVRISRESFAATTAAAAVAGATASMPAAAAAAASEGMAAPADAVLLGVVEDSLLEEDGCGNVSSLMDGEARGHLYRRSIRGLGQLQPPPRQQDAQPASVPLAAVAAAGGQATTALAAAQQQQQQERPAATQAQAEPAQQQPAAFAPPPARPAFLPVSAAPARPAFLSVSAPAAKPAFLSVGVPAAKPAFLSVATAAPKPAVAAVAAAPEPALPACLGFAAPAVEPAAAPAAPPRLALDITAGRKRKKPAAAAATAMQQQEAAAAEGPKSWEDWLQPMGGADAAAAPQAAAPAVRQQQKQPQGKRRR